MTRTTQQIRDAWGPACRGRTVSTLDAWRALDASMRKWGYRPKAGQTWGYNCRRITGGSGYSLHAFDPGERFVFWTGVAITTAIAGDINSLANPYGPRLVTDMPRGMIDDILAIRTVDGVQVFKWGGYYSRNKDAMHFEIVASPAELTRGIDWATVKGGKPADEEDEMSSEDVAKIRADLLAIKKILGVGEDAAADHKIINLLVEAREGKFLEATDEARDAVKAYVDERINAAKNEILEAIRQG